nr:hypothetical protein CFP56_21161 [Quercus suber]
MSVTRSSSTSSQPTDSYEKQSRCSKFSKVPTGSAAYEMLTRSGVRAQQRTEIEGEGPQSSRDPRRTSKPLVPSTEAKIATEDSRLLRLGRHQPQGKLM